MSILFINAEVIVVFILYESVRADTSATHARAFSAVAIARATSLCKR